MADLPNLNLVSTPSVSSTAILRSTAVIGDARIEGQMRFDQLEVGKSFQAVITSMMQDGKATVQFALFHLKLRVHNYRCNCLLVLA